MKRNVLAGRAGLALVLVCTLAFLGCPPADDDDGGVSDTAGILAGVWKMNPIHSGSGLLPYDDVTFTVTKRPGDEKSFDFTFVGVWGEATGGGTGYNGGAYSQINGYFTDVGENQYQTHLSLCWPLGNTNPGTPEGLSGVIFTVTKESDTKITIAVQGTGTAAGGTRSCMDGTYTK
ncbi:hypothetical protein AGMMS4952_21590 [Spirochaetia bacterium]|nr:hypothetical protein AGMMS4952_21590 [Spirochaetia bacterium]